jgi:hypothetical protein
MKVQRDRQKCPIHPMRAAEDSRISLLAVRYQIAPPHMLGINGAGRLGPKTPDPLFARAHS